MIDLPDAPAPRSIAPSFLDQGFIQRGAASLRVDRPGGRWAFEVQYPPMKANDSRQFTALLTRAKRAGLRVEIPLLQPQPMPATVVVDGGAQTGASIKLRGFGGDPVKILTGFWLTIEDGAGEAYLHQVLVDAVTTAGAATLQIEPPLREIFADGASVEMTAPYIQGFMDGEVHSWTVPVNGLIAPAFTVEEFA